MNRSKHLIMATLVLFGIRGVDWEYLQYIVEWQEELRAIANPN